MLNLNQSSVPPIFHLGEQRVEREIEVRRVSYFTQ